MSQSNKSLNQIDGQVAEDLVGEVWPSAEPGENPVLYGHAVLEPRNPVEVRSLQTFRLIYTVGRYGLDDTGAIRVVFRAMSDGQALQTTDHASPNYVTANTNSGEPYVETKSDTLLPSIANSPGGNTDKWSEPIRMRRNCCSEVGILIIFFI